MCIEFEGGRFGAAFFQVDIVQGVIEFWSQNIFSCGRKLLYLDREVLQEIINPNLN